jgi:hypothetical protein
MADIVVTAAQVEAIDPLHAEIYNFIAGATITQGQVVYMTTTGTLGVADATTAGGLYQARGIALNGGAAGQAISVLKRGRCAGFTVSGMNASAPVFLSETAGALASATPAGTGTAVICGIVVAMPDKDATDVFYADFRWQDDWA